MNKNARTDLGRMLSKEYRSQFTHPTLGCFSSLLNFWFFLQMPKDGDKIRFLETHRVYAVSRKYRLIGIPHFKRLIFEGNYYKITQNATLRKEIIQGQLPFQCYHYQRQSQKDTETNYKIIHTPYPIEEKSAIWLIPQVTAIQEILRSGVSIEHVNTEELAHRHLMKEPAYV